MKKIVCFAVLSLILCSVPEKRKTVTFWAMGAEGERVKVLIKEFEREHEDIKIDLQRVPWNSAHEKLLTAYAGNAAPDVFQLGSTWVPEFQAIGVIKNLDGLIDASEKLKKSYFYEGVWEANRIGESIYGVPWYVDTRILFYRSDWFEKAGLKNPPAYWDEWLAACKALKELDEDNYPLYLTLQYAGWQELFIFIKQNGGAIFNENQTYSAIKNKATVEAIEDYLALFEKGYAPVSQSEFSNIYQAFGEGKIKMLISGPWDVNEFRERLSGLDSVWKTAPLPVKKNGCSVAGGASLVIAKDSKLFSEAWEFVEFLTEKEIQKKWYDIMNNLPVLKSEDVNEKVLNDAKMKPFIEQMARVVPPPKVPEWEQVAETLKKGLESVRLKEKTLEEALDGIERDINRILEKRRWLIQKEQEGENEG